jgi:hypothetical protein
VPMYTLAVIYMYKCLPAAVEGGSSGFVSCSSVYNPTYPEINEQVGTLMVLFVFIL